MSVLKKVLYVDDSPDIRELAKIALESLGGFEVEACENGKVALEIAKQRPPDLILLDVMMPVMDGIATIDVLRKTPELAGIPVVFMTAKVARGSEIQEYINLGAVGVITKPFDPMTLCDQIKEFWLKAQ